MNALTASSPPTSCWVIPVKKLWWSNDDGNDDHDNGNNDHVDNNDDHNNDNNDNNSNVYNKGNNDHDDCKDDFNNGNNGQDDNNDDHNNDNNDYDNNNDDHNNGNNYNDDGNDDYNNGNNDHDDNNDEHDNNNNDYDDNNDDHNNGNNYYDDGNGNGPSILDDKDCFHDGFANYIHYIPENIVYNDHNEGDSNYDEVWSQPLPSLWLHILISWFQVMIPGLVFTMIINVCHYESVIEQWIETCHWGGTPPATEFHLLGNLSMKH